MFIRVKESHADFEGTLVEIPQSAPHDPHVPDPIKAGQGRCRSCDCTGYRPDKDNKGYCKCGHHFSQHF